MNNQNNNGNKFFTDIPNDTNMNNGNNFDPFTGQPVNKMNEVPASASTVPVMEQPVQNPMPAMNFDPNTGKPLNGSSNKKGLFIAIGCIVVAAILFFVFGVKVTTCSNEDEQFGVEITTKVTSVAIFGDVKSAKFVMEYDFSDVDEDEKEKLMESLIETFEDEEDCKIKEKGDKIIISMEGFKDEDKGDYPIDEFIDNAEDLGLTCK